MKCFNELANGHSLNHKIERQNSRPVLLSTKTAQSERGWMDRFTFWKCSRQIFPKTEINKKIRQKWTVYFWFGRPWRKPVPFLNVLHLLLAFSAIEARLSENEWLFSCRTFIFTCLWTFYRFVTGLYDQFKTKKTTNERLAPLFPLHTWLANFLFSC